MQVFYDEDDDANYECEDAAAEEALDAALGSGSYASPPLSESAATTFGAAPPLYEMPPFAFSNETIKTQVIRFLFIVCIRAN